MEILELNRGSCRTYLIASERGGHAALVDPVRERLERYLGVLAYHRLTLDYTIDTHTHADHRTASFDLRALAGARVVMHRRAEAPQVDVHVDDGDRLPLGDGELSMFYTPGHTPDSICVGVPGHLFTGDTLFIRGTGRTDFPGGDAGAQYDAITAKLFAQPSDTVVWPGHEYRGRVSSTIGDEKAANPRLAHRTREQYVETMASLGLPLPDKIHEVLQPNQTALPDGRLEFPSLAEVARVAQLTPEDTWALVRAAAPPPMLLDVREADEWSGELGHVPGSLLLPLKELPERVGMLARFKAHPIVAVGRAGARSNIAAAMLIKLGFESVSNLKGGILGWHEAGLPVEW